MIGIPWEGTPFQRFLESRFSLDGKQAPVCVHPDGL
jgi:hypothetical protein